MPSHATSHMLPTEVSEACAFIHRLAGLILSTHEQFENVWDITNRVCDQHADEIAAIPSGSLPQRALAA